MKKTGNQHLKKIRERFSKISLKKGFFWILFFSIIAVIGSNLILNTFNINSNWQDLTLTYAIYVIPFLLVFWVLRGVNRPFSSILKGGTAEISQILMVIPLLIISISVVWMIILILNLIDVEIAQTYLNWISNSKIFEFDPEATLLQYVLFLGSITIIAPVMEEIIFRGIMIERLGAKYNYSWAVIISSFIFAVFHASPVGAFIYGIFLCLIYLKTESLTAPILIHITNNTFATIMMFADEKFSIGYGSWETVEPYLKNAWIGIFLFTLSSVWLGWYVKHNWQTIAGRKPFNLETEEVSS